MVAWLESYTPFPPVTQALRAPNGLLAASAEVSPTRILQAYQQGIFPWYSEPDPVLWWSPDPRMVLYTNEFNVSRSLRKTLQKITQDPQWEIRVNHDCAAVFAACAAPRRLTDGTWSGTWITAPMQAAYLALHQQGWVHSVETWYANQLIGGLYGVGIGKMFYGESMFTRQTDASKIALAHLVYFLREQGVTMIDCQQNTAHLASLGAREISRSEFIAHLAHTACITGEQIHWPEKLYWHP